MRRLSPYAKTALISGIAIPVISLAGVIIFILPIYKAVGQVDGSGTSVSTRTSSIGVHVMQALIVVAALTFIVSLTLELIRIAKKR